MLSVSRLAVTVVGRGGYEVLEKIDPDRRREARFAAGLVDDGDEIVDCSALTPRNVAQRLPHGSFEPDTGPAA